MTGYDLSRIWFDWCFENPELIKPNHSALYFFCIEHCNRLGWKKKFGIPTNMAKEAIGIKSYGTYISTLNDLVDFGFIEMVEKSKNQYSSNIIALSKNVKALDKALDKATVKHASKQTKSTHQSIDSIDKPITNNKEPITFTEPLVSVEKSKVVFNDVKLFFINLYFDEYHTDYYFLAKDAAKIKSIIKKVHFKMKERIGSKEITEQELIDASQFFIKATILVADPWLKSNMSTANIDTKFNEIYSSIKNPQNGIAKSKQKSIFAD